MNKLDEAIDALVADERVTAAVKTLLLEAFREKLRGLGFEIVPIAKDAEQDDTTARAAAFRRLQATIEQIGRPVAERVEPPVCPYCWGDRQDGLTDAEWGDQVARCREYKPSYDAIRRTLWAYGKPFTGRLSGAHLRVDLARGSDRTERIEVCPRCGGARASGFTEFEWTEQIENCRRGRASVPKEKG